MKYTVELIEDEKGDLALPIPEEVLAQVGWKENDTLRWADNGDGTFTLTLANSD